MVTTALTAAVESMVDRLRFEVPANRVGNAATNVEPVACVPVMFTNTEVASAGSTRVSVGSGTVTVSPGPIGGSDGSRNRTGVASAV